MLELCENTKAIRQIQRLQIFFSFFSIINTIKFHFPSATAVMALPSFAPISCGLLRNVCFYLICCSNPTSLLLLSSAITHHFRQPKKLIKWKFFSNAHQQLAKRVTGELIKAGISRETKEPERRKSKMKCTCGSCLSVPWQAISSLLLNVQPFGPSRCWRLGKQPDKGLGKNWACRIIWQCGEWVARLRAFYASVHESGAFIWPDKITP